MSLKSHHIDEHEFNNLDGRHKTVSEFLAMSPAQRADVLARMIDVIVVNTDDNTFCGGVYVTPYEAKRLAWKGIWSADVGYKDQERFDRAAAAALKKMEGAKKCGWTTDGGYTYHNDETRRRGAKRKARWNKALNIIEEHTRIEFERMDDGSAWEPRLDLVTAEALADGYARLNTFTEYPLSTDR